MGRGREFGGRFGKQLAVLGFVWVVNGIMEGSIDPVIKQRQKPLDVCSALTCCGGFRKTYYRMQFDKAQVNRYCVPLLKAELCLT